MKFLHLNTVKISYLMIYLCNFLKFTNLRYVKICICNAKFFRNKNDVFVFIDNDS